MFAPHKWPEYQWRPTREQYERAMRAPIGKEWNTVSSLREATRPAVTTRAGVAIEPVTKTKELKRTQESAMAEHMQKKSKKVS